MRRAPIVLTATVLGTAGVLLFKPLPTSAVVPTDSGSNTTGGSTSSASDGSSASSTPAPSATSDAGGSTDAGSDSSDPAASATATATAKDGTYTGDAETVRWGTTQVKVTIAGGKITDVTVLQENQNESRSIQISENAFPTLRSEVLEKQTAAVDTISGPTYTSAQYEASLQSALDQADYTAPDGSTASTDVSNLQESGRGGGH